MNASVVRLDHLTADAVRDGALRGRSVTVLGLARSGIALARFFADAGARVTAYDARTGKQKWRFYTVPGNPAKGFESEAMKRAARARPNSSDCASVKISSNWSKISSGISVAPDSSRSTSSRWCRNSHSDSPDTAVPGCVHAPTACVAPKLFSTKLPLPAPRIY